MFDFPRIVNDTSFGGASVFFLILLVVAVFGASKVNGTPWHCLIWGAIAAWTGSVSLLMKQPGTNDPTYRLPVWNVVLTGTIVAMAIITVLRNVLRAQKDHRLTAVVAAGVGCGSILLFYLLPLLGHPAYMGHRITCKNNIRQISLAMHNYYDVYNTFPLAVAGPPAASWRLHLLAYLDRRELHEQFDFTAAWDSPKNAALQHTRLDEYLCPQRVSETDEDGRFLTSYVVPSGDGALFGPQRTT